MSDKIAEIRARHARHELAGSSGSVIDTTGFSWTIPGLVAHADRATLLDEVDRQRAEIERLRAALRDIERGDYSDPMCERTPEQRARDALESKP